MAVFLPGRVLSAMCSSAQKEPIAHKNQQLKHEAAIIRRRSLVCCGSLLASILVSPPSWADGNPDDKKGEDEGVAGAFKSLFDPSEKTKSGKVICDLIIIDS